MLLYKNIQKSVLIVKECSYLTRLYLQIHLVINQHRKLMAFYLIIKIKFALNAV